MRPLPWLISLTATLLCAAVGQPTEVGQRATSALYPPVVPGHALSFPDDFGSHDAFRTEWWYVTGWLKTARGAPLGFQITFFRTRPWQQLDNPSAFAARQLLIAHVAISDPERGQLWRDQRVGRAALGLAGAASGDTQVWLDDWQLARRAGGYRAVIAADGFALQLALQATQPPLLNGENGYSRKGPAASSASYYYSEPHLRVTGAIVRGAQRDAVEGEAWLDHEWSSEYLDERAAGWDWVGINFADGGALTAFRIRDRRGDLYWGGATLRSADGHAQSFTGAQLQWTPLRRWKSPRTAIIYPVGWQLRVGERSWELQPLLDDQENDTRLTTGAVYWEGAVRAAELGRQSGVGYLELTGYDKPLVLGAR